MMQACAWRVLHPALEVAGGEVGLGSAMTLHAARPLVRCSASTAGALARTADGSVCVQPVAAYTDFKLGSKIAHGTQAVGLETRVDGASPDATSTDDAGASQSKDGPVWDIEDVKLEGISDSDDEGDESDTPHRLIYVLQRVDTA